MTETLVLQPAEAAAQDTFINSGAKDTAYATFGTLNFRNYASASEALIPLIKFDLSSIPAGSVVTSATLELTANNIIAGGDTPTVLHRILSGNSGWVEACTWNYAVPSTTAWAGSAGAKTSGTDYAAATLGSFKPVTGNPNGTLYTITLDTDEVESMIADNNGILFHAPAALFLIHSSSSTTAAYRPKLTIVYTGATYDLTAVDLTLAPVTFGAPTLTNVIVRDDLTAADFTLSAVTFNAPTLEYNWNTPDCRNYVIDAEDRTLVIGAEQREYVIDRDMRGLLITCGNESKYSVETTYNGLTGKDFTLAQPNFDIPILYEIPAHVPEPDAAFSFAPYIVDDGDGTFSVFSKTAPYGAFDLEKHAGITVNKTYYVSMTGNDSNDGLTMETAFRNFSVAFAKADVDRIYIGAGTYGYGNTGLNRTSTRNLEVIGVGKVYITTDYNGWIGAYSKVGNHYEGSYALTLGGTMYDLSIIDASGIVTKYTAKASAEEVDATPGSYYFSDAADMIYVRTIDDRAPDADIVFSSVGIFIYGGTDLSLYTENLYVIGGVSGTKLYTKNCIFDGYNFTINGNVYPTIFQNTTVTRTIEDCVRCDGGKVILIDCTMYNSVQHGTTNLTSCHGGNMVMVNGEYSYTSGRCIHDVGNGKGWYLGVHAHHSNTLDIVDAFANFAATLFEGYRFEMWCDQCVSSDSGLDFETGTDVGTLHKHNCTGDATDVGLVDTYDY